MKNDPDEFGDYPDHYCSICFDIKYVKMKEEYEAIDWLHNNLLTKLEAQVKKESLSRGKGTKPAKS